jgi:uncharacterized membrane protein YdfJ with MMPL/SSD domain
MLVIESTINWIKDSYGFSNEFIKTLPKFVPVVFGYVFCILLFRLFSSCFPNLSGLIIILLIVLLAILFLLILGTILSLMGYRKK